MPTFTSAIGPILWETNATLLTIEMAGRIHLLPWDDIRGAGIVLLPQGSAANAPIGRHLVIAPARENYLLRIPLGDQSPVSSDHSRHDSRLATHDSALATDALTTDALTTDALTTDALITELRAHLGERFHTNLTPDGYRKVLIPAWANLPEWAMPAAVLGFVALSALFLVMVILISLPQVNDWSIVWWQVGMGLVVWLLIIGGILAVYRKLWMK